MELLQEVWGVVLLISAIIAGFVYLRSTLAKQSHNELSDLAETRGETIADLRSELHNLERKVASLEGQMAAIQAIKAREIALEVVRMIQGIDDVGGTPV